MTTPTNDCADANGNAKPAAKPKGGKRTFAPGATNRSRVTNGKQLFATNACDVDPRWARRLRDIIWLHTNDLGGADVVSSFKQSLIRRAAVETVELELIEQKFARNGKGASPQDLVLYAQIANSLRRHLEALGLERVARDVTPTLDEIARSIEAEEQDAAAADG
jgi:hypothetical protein